MVFQPSLSVFRSFSDSMPHSWSLDKRIKSDSTGRHPPQPVPTGQVSSHFPCYTPRITHFLTINPSQIDCQVIIYTETSQSEADPHFSNFTSPPRLAEVRCFREESSCTSWISHGGTPLAFWLCSSLDNKVIGVKICLKLLKHFQSRQQQQNGTKVENKPAVHTGKREKYWKIFSGKGDIAAKYVWVVSQDKSSQLRNVNHIFHSQKYLSEQSLVSGSCCALHNIFKKVYLRLSL